MSEPASSSFFDSNNTWGPKLDQFGQKLIDYGPSAALGGATIAGLLHLLKQNAVEAQESKKRKDSSDVLTVTLPPKQAEQKQAGMWGNVLRAILRDTGAGVREAATKAKTLISEAAAKIPAAGAAPAAEAAASSAAGAAAAAPGVFKRLRDSFASWPKSQSIPAAIGGVTIAAPAINAIGAHAGTAAGNLAGKIQYGVSGGHDPITSTTPPDPAAAQTPSGPGRSRGTDMGLTLAALVGGGTLGYKAIDSLLQHRAQKQKERQLEDAKNQYGALLGQTLTAGKTAELGENFPIIQGLLGSMAIVDSEIEPHDKKAADLIDLTSAPSTLAVITGVLAHNWMYNRQKELSKLHENTKPSPPKEIRLVSAPAPAPQPSVPALTEESDVDEEENGKVAGAEELLGALGVASAVKDEAKALDAPKEEKSTLDPAEMVEVAPGTVALQTTDGPVTIEAEDADAARTLHANKGKIRKLMNILQVQPQVAA